MRSDAGEVQSEKQYFSTFSRCTRSSPYHQSCQNQTFAWLRGFFKISSDVESTIFRTPRKLRSWWTFATHVCDLYETNRPELWRRQDVFWSTGDLTYPHPQLWSSQALLRAAGNKCGGTSFSFAETRPPQICSFYEHVEKTKTFHSISE